MTRAASPVLCANCGEPIHRSRCAHWIHDHGLYRCQGNVPKYGPIAEPSQEDQ